MHKEKYINRKNNKCNIKKKIKKCLILPERFKSPKQNVSKCRNKLFQNAENSLTNIMIYNRIRT